MSKSVDVLKDIDIIGLAKASKEALETPYTNLGGLELQNTGFVSLNGYKLDWFSFTIDSTKYSFVDVLACLNYDISDFEIVNGRYFYNSGLTLGNYVNVYYNDVTKMVNAYSSNTCNIVFTGQGCTDLYNKNDEDIIAVFEKLVRFSIKVTRIDIAFDDFEGILDFDIIENKLKSAHYKSAMKSYNIVRTSDTKKKNLGNTIYIGSSRSGGSQGNYFARMYDKFAQYEQKNQQLPDAAKIHNCWQRYEISYTKSKAESVYNSLLYDETYKYNIDKLYKDTFRNIVEFLEPKENDKNKYRWSVCDWWDDFLSYNDKYGFIAHERDMDIKALLKWLKIAVMPNIKILELVAEHFGYDIYEFFRKFELDKDFTKKQKRLFNNSVKLSDENFIDYMNDFMRIKGNDNNG